MRRPNHHRPQNRMQPDEHQPNKQPRKEDRKPRVGDWDVERVDVEGDSRRDVGRGVGGGFGGDCSSGGERVKMVELGLRGVGGRKEEVFEAFDERDGVA